MRVDTDLGIEFPLGYIAAWRLIFIGNSSPASNCMIIILGAYRLGCGSVWQSAGSCRSVHGPGAAKIVRHQVGKFTPSDQRIGIWNCLSGARVRMSPLIAMNVQLSHHNSPVTLRRGAPLLRSAPTSATAMFLMLAKSRCAYAVWEAS